MNQRTLWDERLGMLMACGSPGSALAYHLGQTTLTAKMVRRGITDESLADQSEQPVTAEVRGAQSKPKTWLGRIWDRVEAWTWQRQIREREAYLAQSTDLVDLETRMRRLDGDVQLARAQNLY